MNNIIDPSINCLGSIINPQFLKEIEYDHFK